MRSEGRKYLTKKEATSLRESQLGLCACGCGRELGDKVVAEHTIPNFFKPGKPDAIWRWDCAMEKTKSDLTRIAKTKRQAHKMGVERDKPVRKKKMIATRGFSGWRRFNGQLVKKED